MIDKGAVIIDEVSIEFQVAPPLLLVIILDVISDAIDIGWLKGCDILFKII
jgi:hypothetical protein